MDILEIPVIRLLIRARDDVDTYVTFAASKNMQSPMSSTRMFAPTTAPAVLISPDVLGVRVRSRIEREAHEQHRLRASMNPMLSRDKQAFIDALADVPPKAVDMEQILTFNRGHHEVKASARRHARKATGVPPERADRAASERRGRLDSTSAPLSKASLDQTELPFVLRRIRPFRDLRLSLELGRIALDEASKAPAGASRLRGSRMSAAGLKQTYPPISSRNSAAA